MKGIIFTEPNFHLTVQGIKKQTRRIVQVPKGAVGVQVQTRAIDGAFWGCYALNENERTINPKTGQEWVINPRYKVGETVYLKEPYIITGQTYEYEYLHENKTDIACIKRNGGYKNKLFMPEIAARYFIKITNVRAERLQDISEEDCINEGIKVGRCGNESKWMKAFYMEEDNQPYITARRAYEMLINKINGKDTWQSNPWVWVYEYELIKQ